MPSKYYNPRLARNVGKAQASQYVSVSGVIDKAFEPFHEDVKLQQERLYKQNQEKEKQRQEIEKNLANDIKFGLELKGVAPQGQQGLYQTAMTEQFGEYAKAYKAATGDPVKQQMLKSNFQSRLSNMSKPHELRRTFISTTAENIEKNGGLSSATSAQDLATYQRIKNFENLSSEQTTFHPETGRPVEIIFGEDGKPTGEFFDPIEAGKTINLIDKSGDAIYNDVMNKRFPKLLKDAKNSNLTPQAMMYHVDAALEGVNDQTALHIGIEHLKIGGANNEFSEYLNAVFNDKDETAIYYDMPNDYNLEEINEFLNMSEEQKAKIPNITKITGKHGGVEMVKDRLRYVWAQTAANQEANNQEDEDDALAKENRIKQNELDKIEARKNKTGSEPTSTEEERIAGFQSIMPDPKDFDRTKTQLRAGSLGSNQAPYHFDDDYKNIRHNKWEKLMANALQKEGITVRKSESNGKNILEVNAGTKSSPNWQELTPAEDNAETLAGLFPDKTFNTNNASKFN